MEKDEEERTSGLKTILEAEPADEPPNSRILNAPSLSPLQNQEPRKVGFYFDAYWRSRIPRDLLEIITDPQSDESNLGASVYVGRRIRRLPKDPAHCPLRLHLCPPRSSFKK